MTGSVQINMGACDGLSTDRIIRRIKLSTVRHRGKRWSILKKVKERN